MKIANVDITKNSLYEAFGISARRQYDLNKLFEDTTDKLIDQLNEFAREGKTKYVEEKENVNMGAAKKITEKYAEKIACVTSKANVISLLAEHAENNAELSIATITALKFCNKLMDQIKEREEEGSGHKSLSDVLKKLKEMLND